MKKELDTYHLESHAVRFGLRLWRKIVELNCTKLEAAKEIPYFFPQLLKQTNHCSLCSIYLMRNSPISILGKSMCPLYQEDKDQLISRNKMCVGYCLFFLVGLLQRMRTNGMPQKKLLNVLNCDYGF